MRLCLYPMADAKVRALAPDENEGRRRSLYVGTHGHGNRYRSLVRFGLPASDGSTLDQALFRLYQERHRGLGGDHPRPLVLDLFGVVEVWREGSVTWRTQPESDPRPSAVATAGDCPAWLTFDITVLTQRWLGGERPNHGFVLRSRYEQHEGLCEAPSRHHPDSTHWPALDLVFSDKPCPERRVVTVDLGPFTSEEGWRGTPAFDSAGLDVVTGFAVYVEGGDVELRVCVSFDARTWLADRACHTVTGEHRVEALTATHYARFYRTDYRSREPRRPGTVRVVFQGTS